MNVKIDNRRGSALLIAICLVGMISIILLVAVKTSNTEIDISYNQVHKEDAFYISEAGANRAMALLQVNPAWDSGWSNVEFGNGFYTVVVADSSDSAALVDTVIVRSAGVSHTAAVIVELTVVPDEYHPFQFGMFADEWIDIQNSMFTDSYNSDSGGYTASVLTTDGDVGSNGDITLFNGSFVGGDVATSLTGGADVDSGATVTGIITDKAEEQYLPEIPQETFDWAETNNDALSGLSGSYSYNPSTNVFSTTEEVILTSGVYFFSEMTLTNSASLILAPGAKVEIYVTGDIELKNSAELNPGGAPGDLKIFSQGDFVLKNSGDMYATFYSPTGSADLRNSGDFYGSIIANDIIAHNSSGFHYDRNLSEYFIPGLGTMEMIAWREIGT